MQKIIVILLVFGVLNAAHAQDNDFMNIAGKIEDYHKKEGPPNILNNDLLDAATVNIMKSQAMKVVGIAENCPRFHEPKGFNLMVQIAINKPSPYSYPIQHMITSECWFAIFEYYKNEMGKVSVEVETGGSYYIDINDFWDLFPGNPGNIECDQYQLPRFFTKNDFSVKDSTAEYFVLKNDRRVITNGKPLTIPYTREQYLKFFIKRKEALLAEQNKGLAEFMQIKEKAMTAPDGHKVTAADKNNEKYNYLFAAQESAGAYIPGLKRNVEETQQKLIELNNQLGKLSVSEKRKPGYYYFGMNSSAKELFEPTTEDDPNAVALYTPNPDYFNYGLTKTSVQLITLIKAVKPDYISKDKILTSVNDCIDYMALKKMIQ
ncbi:MAG TPA: hypothetical protein DCO83_07230 [Mucilaginibacter sp.]|jgi:hypothetical protein|nr:hypothetical protein [Mucilaginibacter sp.]